MNEDISTSRNHMVSVNVLDGEIVDALVAHAPLSDCFDLNVSAGTRLEPLPSLESNGGLPLAKNWHPEGVGIGGDDDACLVAALAIDIDSDLDEVLRALTGD